MGILYDPDEVANSLSELPLTELIQFAHLTNRFVSRIFNVVIEYYADLHQISLLIYYETDDGHVSWTTSMFPPSMAVGALRELNYQV